MPRVFNGETVWENLVAACNKCNHTRGNMEAYHFYALIVAGNLERLRIAREREHERLDERFIRKAVKDINIAWAHIEWTNRIQAWT